MSEDETEVDYAFPLPKYAADRGRRGMRLVDYFAGRALASMRLSYGISVGDATRAAEAAYRVAGAMMAVRRGRRGP